MAEEGARPLYAVLGLGADATPEAIKKAYRRLALQHHPDRQQDASGSEDAFARVAFAYEVLGHPQRRKRYDLTGEVPQADAALGRKAGETFLAEYVRGAPKAARDVTQADMSLHSLQNYEVLEVDGRDVPEYMRGIVMQGLSYLVAVVDGMEDKEVVLLRHYVMDQMYALLAYTPPLDDGAFAQRGYTITYYDHPLQVGIQPSWSDQNDPKTRKEGAGSGAGKLRLIDPATIEQRRLVALGWHGAPSPAAARDAVAQLPGVPGSGRSDERLRLGVRALLQVGVDLESRTIHQVRRELERVLRLEANDLDQVGATSLMALAFEEMAEVEGGAASVGGDVAASGCEATAVQLGANGGCAALDLDSCAAGGREAQGLEPTRPTKDCRVRVHPSGLLGVVIVDDPGDPNMAYKVRFENGLPDNWFRQCDVELA